MMKVLLVTTVSGFVPQFEMNNVRILQEMGCEVHYASNYKMPSYGKDNHRLDGTGIIRHQIDFVRSPFSIRNRIVFRQLKQLMEQEKFDLIHCHTPMGAVMARLTAHATRTKPVVYTAHGFHFYKGAPLVNWLCYYPMEKWLSRYTDQQICINQEDYRIAKKFYARYVDYIPGAGIDLKKVSSKESVDADKIRRELEIEDGKKIILSAGELIKRKNHETVIRAMALIEDKSLIYVICGHGVLEEYLKNLVKELNLENQIRFAGYRSDIFDLYQVADLYVFPSFQEGLPMAMLEAMASGLPVICSDIRGSRDLMELSLAAEKNIRWKFCNGGAVVRKADDAKAYAQAIQQLTGNSLKMEADGKRNAEKSKKFSVECVDQRMREIYHKLVME